MDSTCKLFDIPKQKMRQTFRGHTDSVNDVQFARCSNVFASAGADKTISLWDIREGLLKKTFYGHLNAVNHIDFSLDVIDSLFKLILPREIHYAPATQTGSSKSGTSGW